MRWVSVLALLPALAVATDFRAHSWGDSLEEVVRREPGEPIHRYADRLIYRGTIANLPSQIFLEFDAGRLVRGSYLIVNEHGDDNTYIEDFSRIDALLEDELGTRSFDLREDWRDETYRDDHSRWGRALTIGHLQYRSSWRTDRSAVHHVLQGERNRIRHGLVYESIAHPQRDHAQGEQLLAE